MAAALRRGDCYLLGRRPEGAANAGKWEFPGGKVRPEEAESEALCRELREELEIEAVVGKRLAVVRHVYPHIALRLSLFACQLVGGEPSARYHSELRWVAPEDFETLDLSEADRALLAAMRC